MDVLRHGETFAGSAVGQGDLMLFPSFVSLDQHEKLSEYPGEVPAVDLVDDEYEGRFRSLRGSLAELEEHAVPERKTSCFGRTPTLHEILVGI